MAANPCPTELPSDIPDVFTLPSACMEALKPTTLPLLPPLRTSPRQPGDAEGTAETNGDKQHPRPSLSQDSTSPHETMDTRLHTSPLKQQNDTSTAPTQPPLKSAAAAVTSPPSPPAATEEDEEEKPQQLQEQNVADEEAHPPTQQEQQNLPFSDATDAAAPTARRLGSTSSAPAAVQTSYPGLSPPGPTHHLTRHWLPENSKGDHSLDRLGVSTLKEAEAKIKNMQQRDLRSAFHKVYGTATSSFNNNWLRRKLLEAVGSGQANKKKSKATGRRVGSLEPWEREAQRDRTETRQAAAAERRAAAEEADSQREAAAAETLAEIAGGGWG